MKSGIAIAGTILVDKINEISAYPSCGELTKIKRVSKSVGGCVPNVAIDLKRLSPELIVKAVGKIGADENGNYVKTVLSRDGVDIENISMGADKTSFTQVMSVSYTTAQERQSGREWLWTIRQRPSFFSR